MPLHLDEKSKPGPLGCDWKRTALGYEARLCELEAALRALATTPAVVRALGSNHTPECYCPLCRANLLLHRQ